MSKKTKPRTRHLSGWVAVKSVSTEKTRLTLIDRRGKLNITFDLETWQWTNLAHNWILSYAAASQNQKDWMDKQLSIAKGGTK
jgi:hypothetical protein